MRSDTGNGALANRNTGQLNNLKKNLAARLDQIQAADVTLDLTRGKPSTEQVSLSNALDGILMGDFTADNGQDVRNYGGLSGIAEAKVLGARLMDVPEKNVLVGGNSSLSLMHQCVHQAMQIGLRGPDSAWQNELLPLAASERIKFLCPVPGYDRHFAICEDLGIEMINVPLISEGSTQGPNINKIIELLKADPLIKGIWCVPKHSNPTGCTYAPEVVEQLAGLAKHAGPNFLVLWDNAYSVHDLVEEVELANIFSLARNQGYLDNVITFASTSKITFAGAGISFMGAAEDVLNSVIEHLKFQTIGYDKVNQLRHAKFLGKSLQAHMAKHADLIRPKFCAVQEALKTGLTEDRVAHWSQPSGGYFISLDVAKGLAKRVVNMAAEAGVVLTPAGATFPYCNDPNDENIRIAPTYPNLEEVKSAMDILVLCIRIASIDQLLSERS